MTLELGGNWTPSRYRRGERRCKPCHSIEAHLQKTAAEIAGSPERYRALPLHDRRELLRKARGLARAAKQFRIESDRIDTRIVDGWVYVISNPAWPDHVKVGSAVDIANRLAVFQTYCPNRAYEVVAAVYVDDRRAAEYLIHRHLRRYRRAGEWFYVSPDAARAAITAELPRAPFVPPVEYLR